MVQYYTLEEAAALLQIPADKLKEMVKRNEVRAFQDRGTLRFRKQEVDELVRSRGLGSDPDLPLGETPKKIPGMPSSSARRRSKTAPDQGTFNIAEDEQVSLADNPPSGAQKGSPSGSGRRKTSTSKTPGPRSPQPKPASDSDVRLVSDSSDMDFHIEADEEPARPKPPDLPKSSARKKSKLPPPSASDSNVPILPPDLSSDSDVKIEPDAGESAVPIGQQGAKSPSDSDIRLEGDPLAGLSGGKRRDDAMITEEIDLDAEAANIEAARQKAKKEKSPTKPPLPTTSPFELSENDLDMGMDPQESSLKAPLTDSSNDFELTAPEDSSPLEPGTDEVPKLSAGSGEEEVTLGELTGGGAGASGINIQDPGDGGISLEGSEDEIEFDLSLDAGGGATPGPTTPKGGKEASSEFELSIPDDDELSNKPPDSDSEFELTLDEEGSSELELEEDGTESTSDSEFELTLDEEGGLGPVDDSSSATSEEDEESKDIFETDFDVPALEDESESEAVPLEGSTELADSEFELELGEDEGGETEEESGSEEFALEEEPEAFEEEDEPAPQPKRRPTKAKHAAVEEEDEEGLDLNLDEDGEEIEEEEEAEPAAVGAAAEAPPAEWGALPAVMLLLSLIVLVIVGIMGFELIQGMWGYHKPAKVTSLVIKPLAEMFGDKLPDE